MLSFSIDIGNSRVKVGLFKGKSLLKVFSFQKNEFPSSQELSELKVEQAMVSSVLAKKETDELLEALKIKIRYLDQNCKLPFANLYKSPDTLGKDRIAAVVGTMVQFPKENVLVIDLGTCITYDFLNNKAEYWGGAISPGVQMRLKAMHQFTSQLPLLEWEVDKIPALIGDTTKNSLLSGAINGAIAEIDGTIEKYKSEYPGLNIMITGGGASFFEKKLKNTIFADSNLVLKGLNEILFYNCENS